MSGTAQMRRFGVRIAPPSVSPSALAGAIVLAQQAEARGLDWVAVAERFDGRGGVPAALTLCAALAAATERIRVATAALPLPLHHPLRVAEEAATVDSLSGGRLELGVGLGAPEAPFGSFGLDAEERAERFGEALAILRAAWSEEPVTFRGKHFACEGVRVHPKPQQAGGPPLWLAARAPAALRRAARDRVGVMLEPGADAAPYLEEHASGDAALGSARVALLAPVGLPAEALRERLASCRGAREWVCLLDVEDARGVESAAEIASVLRDA